MLRTIAAFDRIGEENAFAVLARATMLAAQGRDIINLGIGQPDFRTPNHIVEAAVKALRDGHHGYTPANGIPQLREAVALLSEPDREIIRRFYDLCQTAPEIAAVLGLTPSAVRMRLVRSREAIKNELCRGGFVYE